MPLAKEVAAEFRRLADCLDKEPDAQIDRPLVSWYHYSKDQRELFLKEARLLPRPLKKSVSSSDELSIDYNSPAMWAYAKIPRNAICELIEPAKPAVYKCEPLLSDAQIEEIGSEVA